MAWILRAVISLSYMKEQDLSNRALSTAFKVNYQILGPYAYCMAFILTPYQRL